MLELFISAFTNSGETLPNHIKWRECKNKHMLSKIRYSYKSIITELRSGIQQAYLYSYFGSLDANVSISGNPKILVNSANIVGMNTHSRVSLNSGEATSVVTLRIPGM